MSLAGALSLFIPVPDTIAVFALAGLKVGGSWVFEPVLLALAAAIGGMIGNLSGYLLGLSSGKAITGKFKKNVDLLVNVFNKFGALAIFAFAFTPIPDDLVFIPLGVRRYNPIKALMSSMIGKFLFCLTVAYGARFSIGMIVGMFGTGTSLVSVLVSTTSGMVLTIALFKVDWTKYFGKYTQMGACSKHANSSFFSQKELQVRMAAVIGDLTNDISLLRKNKISSASICLERVRLTTI